MSRSRETYRYLSVRGNYSMFGVKCWYEGVKSLKLSITSEGRPVSWRELKGLLPFINFFHLVRANSCHYHLNGGWMWVQLSNSVATSSFYFFIYFDTVLSRYLAQTSLEFTM